jgi:hypothetical protein
MIKLINQATNPDLNQVIVSDQTIIMNRAIAPVMKTKYSKIENAYAMRYIYSRNASTQ